MIVIDTETTGLEPGYNEIVQIAAIKLLPSYKPDKSTMPMFLYIKPEYPERWSPEAREVNGITAEKLEEEGFPREKAAEIFLDWFERLRCGPLIPLAQNWPFDKAMILDWLGEEHFRTVFHYHYRDTCSAANYINDRHIYSNEKKPFFNVRLGTLAKELNIDYSGAHDAVKDCLICAEVYRKLLNFKLPL